MSEVPDGAHERTLHRTARLRLAEFWCPPDSPRWRVPNVIPLVPHVVFPRTSAIIRPTGHEPVFANANHVMFYNGGQRYHRGLHDPRGDICWFLEVEPSLLAELLDGEEFSFASGPGDAHVSVLVHATVRHLGEERPDPLLVEETLLEALARTIATASGFHGLRQRRLAPQHAALVERAKELLTETASERLSLGELGRRLFTSEYHLARVFRAGTGFSIHGYRNSLRLRLALERLAEEDIDLSLLAHSLGYASHSHFTDTFRAAFGIAPSRVRGGVGRRRMCELLRVVDAGLSA